MRETTKVKTPSDFEVEFHAYLTGKEARELQKIILSHARSEGSGDETKIVGFDPSVRSIAEEYALRTLVVAVNGERAGAFEAVESMKLEDYNAVVNAINAVVKPALEPTDFLAK